MTQEELVAEAKATWASRYTCTHPGIKRSTFRCPECGGILRRCCDTILSWPHMPHCLNFRK